MKKQIFCMGTAALLYGFCNRAAIAASDGTTGSTSTGTLLVSISKGFVAKVSKLNDISLGAYSSGSVSSSRTMCVYTATGSYKITATSANTGATNTFRLNSGTNYITYSVSWSSSGSSSFNSLTHGIQSSALTTTNTTDDNCVTAGADNAGVKIDITSNAMSSAAAGSYTDTLTLVVAPN